MFLTFKTRTNLNYIKYLNVKKAIFHITSNQLARKMRGSFPIFVYNFFTSGLHRIAEELNQGP